MGRRDEREYAAFVVGHQRRLRRTAYLLTGSWDQADDAVQEALIRVYVAWPRLERQGALSVYARRAVVSAVIDMRRRPWRREQASVVAEDAVPVVTGGNDRPADWEIDRGAERLLLVGALRRLAPRQRACVVLRHLEELSVAETAAVLGCSEGTVKSQTARGLRALRNLLDPHDQGDEARDDRVAATHQEES